MTLIEIARIYTDIVNVDNEIPESEHIAKDEVSALRSKYHQLLMDKLREEGGEFSDRFEAMNLAFELVKKDTSTPSSPPTWFEAKNTGS
jgi:hypothetical protein